jgi:hypothetical protein
MRAWLPPLLTRPVVRPALPVAVSDTGKAHSTHKVPEGGSSATIGKREIQRQQRQHVPLCL